MMNAVGILLPALDNLSGQLIESIVGTSGAAQTAAPGTALDTNQTSNARRWGLAQRRFPGCPLR